MKAKRMLTVGLTSTLLGCASPTPETHVVAPAPVTGSVIFIHPDGSGLAAWSFLRLAEVGPDSTTHWDRLARMGLYRGHLANSAGGTSHGGATVHAYGVKVPWDSYGQYGTEPLTALSGERLPILLEAQRAGLSTALVNSGHIGEPGTGAFAASAGDRDSIPAISERVVSSGTDVILSGGEIYLLPRGMLGRHGAEGVREDGRNVIESAERAGYVVVYTKDELAALSDTTRKVLGVFAAEHTFHDVPEEALRRRGLPLYEPGAPTVGEMTEKALRLLRARQRPFLLVVEEEGSDNFANRNNAMGTLEALRRADQAIAVAVDHIARHPRTLLLTAADSDAGGLEVYAVQDPDSLGEPLPPRTLNGAPLDGRTGTAAPPFVSAPDRFGTRLEFGIAWANSEDAMGGIVARAHGLNAELLPMHVDNTDIYRMMYRTLFGREPEGQRIP